jgi:hypothetical protein
MDVGGWKFLFSIEKNFAKANQWLKKKKIPHEDVLLFKEIKFPNTKPTQCEKYNFLQTTFSFKSPSPGD